MTFWFTSDLHFYHRRILEYSQRPFATIEEHNDALISNWNECVKDTDTVFVLGDFSLNKRAAIGICPLLKGEKKYLIPGNHDAVHPRYGQKAEKAKAEYEAAGWVVCQHNAKILMPVFGDDGTITEQYVFWMNHFPADNKDPRFTQYLPPADQPGVWYLCGHVHTAWKTKNRMINVGVDQWNYKPVSLEQIVELIKNLPLD